jgi:hypothetical protein
MNVEAWDLPYDLDWLSFFFTGTLRMFSGRAVSCDRNGFDRVFRNSHVDGKFIWIAAEGGLLAGLPRRIGWWEPRAWPGRVRHDGVGA